MRLIIKIDNTGKTRHKISVNRDHAHILVCKDTSNKELDVLKYDAQYLFEKLRRERNAAFYKVKRKRGYYDLMPTTIKEKYN